MTDALNQATESKTPSHIAYHVRKSDSGKSYSTRIGAAWAHRKGNGFTLQLDAVPLDGRIVLFTPSEKPE